MSSERRLFKDFGGVRNSAVASQPRPSGHITADKRLWCDVPSPKLPSATSFIRRTLSEIRSYRKTVFALPLKLLGKFFFGGGKVCP